MNRKITIIFDINGTLLSRHSRYNESRNQIHNDNASIKQISRAPDFTLHGYKYYFRPYVNELLEYCFKHFRVGIWTSSLPMTAYPVTARLLGPFLDLSHTILDDGKTFTEENFPDSVEEAERLQKICETSLQQLKRTRPNYSFNFMDPDSINSLEEKLLRCNMIKTLTLMKQKAYQDEHIPTYKLCLLWSRRRCILRHTSTLDDPLHFKHKPVAIKDLSQLWKHRGLEEEKSTSICTEYYKNLHLLKHLVVGKRNTALFLKNESDLIPSPFYYPFFGSIDSDKFHPGRTLLIDDAPVKFGLHSNNGISIPEYNAFTDPSQRDQTLSSLISWLELLKRYEPEHSEIVPLFIKTHPLRIRS